MDKKTDIFNFLAIDDSLSTSGQPTEAQISELAKEGYDVIINLALHDDPRYSLPDETAYVGSLGMQYIHIPVQFDAPLKSDLVAFFKAMESMAMQLVDRQKQAISQTSQGLLTESEEVFQLVLWLLLIGLALGITLSYLISRLVSRPLLDAVEMMDDIAKGEGDLTRRMQSERGDEIGSMAASFNCFIDKIHALVRQTAASTNTVIDGVARTSDITGLISNKVFEQE